MARSRARAAAEPDLDALKDFVELPDREASPFFGGRAAEIETVESTLRRIRKRVEEGHWRPAGGETILFQGAPGAGKSALLHHLVQVWRNTGQNAPVVVDTELTHFANERTLALRVAEAADPAIAAQFRRSETTHSTSRADLSGGIPGVVSGSGSAESGHQAASAPAELSLAAVQKALSASERSVVLFLDEAQDLAEFGADKVLPVISQLHKGSHGGPFLTVFAGLAYSSKVLKERGISRFSRGHQRTLSALAFGEATEIVLRMLTEFRVRGGAGLMDQWAQTLANESSGWPQHLHVAMQALVAQLLVAPTPGQLEPVDSQFGSGVLRESAQAREEYYEQRIDEPLTAAPELVAETLRRIGNGALRADALAYIRDAAQPGPGSKSLPKNHDAEMFLDLMIRRGVLQHAPEQKLVCPIPSLRDYVERLARGSAR